MLTVFYLFVSVFPNAVRPNVRGIHVASSNTEAGRSLQSGARTVDGRPHCPVLSTHHLVTSFSNLVRLPAEPYLEDPTSLLCPGS